MPQQLNSCYVLTSSCHRQPSSSPTYIRSLSNLQGPKVNITKPSSHATIGSRVNLVTFLMQNLGTWKPKTESPASPQYLRPHLAVLLHQKSVIITIDEQESVDFWGLINLKLTSEMIC